MLVSIIYIARPILASGPSSNRVLNYQLRLTDTNGIPLSGTKNVKLSFYDAASGGTRLATDCGTTVTPVARKIVFTNGIGSVLIGDTAADVTHNCSDTTAPNALSSSLFSNTVLYLGITVESDAEMTPRKRIVAQGYALNADLLDDLDTSSIGGSVAFIPATDGSGNLTLTKDLSVDSPTFAVDSTNNRVGVGTAAPAFPLEVNGTVAVSGGNSLRFSGSSDASVISGSGDFFLRAVAGSADQPKLAFQDLDFIAKTMGFQFVTDGTTLGTRLEVVDSSSTGLGAFTEAGSFGIGTVAPAAMLSVGASSQFQVNSSGNITTAGTLTVNGTTSTIGDSATDRLNIGGEFRLGLIAADPAGTNGLMFYNSSTNKFRCFESGAWTDCIGSGSGMAIGNTVTSGTAGSVLFVGAASALSQDNANFFWDNTNKRLGLGDATPAATLTVGSGDLFQVDGATGNVTTAGDLAVNGGNLTTTAATFNLVNTNATTVNIGGAATTLNLAGGSGSTGCTVDSAGNFTCSGSVSGGGVLGGSGSAGQATFWTGASTVSGDNDFFWDNTNKRLGIGDATPVATLTVGSGDLFQVDGATGNVTTAGDLAVNGGDLTTTAATGNLFNANATTLNVGGAATALALGATSGTTTVRNALTVNGSNVTLAGNTTIIDMTGTGALELNTTTNRAITSGTGLFTMGGDLAVNGGTISTTDTLGNIFDTNATTLNIGGVATTLNLGATSGTATVNNATVTLANATTLNINGASPSIVTSSAGTANVFNTNATTVNVGGAATTLNLAGGSGATGCTVDGATGNLNCTGSIQGSSAATGNVLPLTDNTYDLGTTALRWRKLQLGPGSLDMTSTTGTSGAGTDYTLGQMSFSGTNLILKTSAVGAGSTGTVKITTGANTGINVDASGNVGIGEASPAALFAVGSGSPFKVDNSGNVTTSGDIAVNGGDLTTTASSFNLVNAAATTVNFAGAATTLSIGAATGTATVNNGLTVNGSTILGDAPSDTITTNARFASSLHPSVDNTYDLGSTGLRWRSLHVGPGSAVVHNDQTDTNKVTLGFSGATARLFTDAATPLQLTTDANNGITVSTKGDVGIGTLSPVSLLDVAQATTGPGTVTTNGTTTLSGTGTEFTNTFRVGDTITVSGETVRTIATIPSNTSLTVTSAFSTTASGLSYTLTGGTRLSVKGNGNIGIGTTAPGRTLDVNGNWGGNSVTDLQSLTADSTVTESTRALVYSLANNSGTTNASVTTTFDVTGLPDIDGTFAFFELKAQKGVTAGAQVQTVDLKVNGTLVTTVGTGNTTTASTLSKNFTLVRVDGVWKVIGAAGDGSGTSAVGSTAKTVLADLTNSTTTMQSTNLSFSMGANETWSAFFALRSFNSNNAADVVYDLTSPSGATCYLSAGAFKNGQSVDTTSCTGTVTPQVSITDEFVILQFTVINGSTPGAVTLRFASTVGGSVAHVDAGSHLAAFIDQGADVAEAYYTTDPSIGPGNVVSIDPSLPNGVTKTAQAYDPGTIGIISTMPGLAMGEKSVPAGARPVYLALVGRVPVKVSDENGPIAVGDELTASATPGVAMKATRPGTIIGRALDAYAGPGVGTIMIFAKVGWSAANVIGSDGTASYFKDRLIFDKAAEATADAPVADSKSLAFRGSAWDAATGQAADRDFTLENVVTDANGSRLSLKNNTGDEVAYFGQNGDIALKGMLYPSDGGILQTNRYISYDGSSGLMGDFMRTNASGWATGTYGVAEAFASDDALEPTELVMIDMARDAAVVRAVKDDAHPAFLLTGVVSTRPGFLAGMNETGSYPVTLSGRVAAKVSAANGPIKIGDPITISSTPGVGMKAVDPTYIVGIALEKWNKTEPGTITVFVRPGWWNGETVIAADTATSRMGFSSTLTEPLDMRGQPIIGIGALEGMGGLWSIDGNGKMIMKEVVADGITVRQSDEKATLDRAVIPSGQDYVQVHNPAITPDSRAFVTMKKNPGSQWWVDEVGEGFLVVKTAQPVVQDIPFDYWLVNVLDERTPPPAARQQPADQSAQQAPATPASPAGTSTTDTTTSDTPASGTSTTDTTQAPAASTDQGTPTSSATTTTGTTQAPAAAADPSSQTSSDTTTTGTTTSGTSTSDTTQAPAATTDQGTPTSADTTTTDQQPPPEPAP